MMVMTPPSLTSEQVRELAYRSWCDRRTIHRFLTGQEIREASERRILQALAEMRASA